MYQNEGMICLTEYEMLINPSHIHLSKTTEICLNESIIIEIFEIITPISNY